MDKWDNFQSECEISLSGVFMGRITRWSLTLKGFLNVLLFFSSVIRLQDISLMFPPGHGESHLA